MPFARRVLAPAGFVSTLLIVAACAGDSGAGPGNLQTSALTLRISPKADSLGVGQVLQLAARVTDRAGVQQPATIAWMSLNNAIATVTSTGTVTGVAAGLVGIVATIGTSADTATVYVRAGELVVEPNAVETAVGEQLQFSVTTRAGASVAASGLSLVWATSDTAIARVDANGNLTAVGAGNVTLTASSGSQQGSAAITVRQKDIASLRITPATSTIYPAASEQLVVTAYDDAGRPMNIPVGSARWNSSSSTILTVDGDGSATGKGMGSAVVSARIGPKSATATVNVLPVPVANVAVTLGVSTLDVGQTTAATATLTDANGNPLSGRTVAWQSSNPAIAAVNASGMVTAVAKGSVTITAIAEGKTGSAAVTVATKTVTSVGITPGSASATVGQTAQLVAVAKDAQGVAMTGKSFTWASSNNAVATVSASGLVTAVTAGTATITATVDGITGQASFSATAVTAASVTVTPSSSRVQAGQLLQLVATAYDATGAVLGSRVPSWASSNPAIATVASDGRVTGVAAGNADIVATVDGKSASAAITVDAPPPAPVATVAVTLAAQTLNVGQSTQATAVLRDAAGNTLSARTIAWSSAAPQLATVSASGVVTTIAAGSATIVATSEGQSGSATLVIGTAPPPPVASVTVSAISASMYVGQSQALTVTLKDAQGNTLGGRTIAWSSSSLGVLTVSPSGQVQAVGVGTATVTAASEGKSGSLGITVTTAPVAPVSSVTVTASTTSLTVGQTTQATATPRDGHGIALTGRAVTWSSSAPNVASVSSSGVITAAASGQAMINATSEGVTGSLAITIQSAGAPPPPPSPPPPDTSTVKATLAELPRTIPAPTFAKATRVVQVTTNLQAALDAAQPGDSLVLSGTFTGNYVLPSKPCGAGITITSAASLPPAGTRVTPTMAASFAKIITPNNAPALKTQNPTCGWRIAGVEIAASASAGVIGTSLNYGIFWLGDGGWTGGGETQTSLAMVPQNIVLDRIYLHGATTTNSTRCLFLNSGATVIRDSWISDCHAVGFDSQAILGCNGPGPYLIENNDLQGATENVMFGGCDPVSSDLIPSDITIRRNYIHKQESWKGTWSIKNLFELKNARRVLLEGNVLEHSWVASQVGMAIVIKSSTENCAACTWEGTKDVTLQWNLFRYSHRGLNIQAIDGSSAGTTASHTERVTVTHNLFTDIGTSNGIAPSDGWLMLLTHDLKDILIQHNTFVGNTPGYGLAAYFTYSGGAARRVEIADNVYAGQSYYALSSDGGNHMAALTAFAGTSWRFAGNAVSQIDQQFWSLYPSGNSYTDRVANLGLASDGSLSSSSGYRNRATDGTDPGANVAQVLSKTQGVMVNP